MNDLALEAAILDTELRHVNFFNGRLLTGGDLSAEQGAQHAHARLLGAAIGPGVAFGLEVSRASDSPPGGPVLVVEPGLAVNRAGQSLRLQCEQRVSLVVAPDSASRDQCVFDDCEPTAPGQSFASGSGYYVLTVAPASQSEGKAPVNGLGNGTASCNSRYLTDGVKFRLFRLNFPSNSSTQTRNLVSRACFGLAPAFSANTWPDALPVHYGWETLLPSEFSAGREVPLAVLEWTPAGLGFVKAWPVRRRLAAPSAADGWSYFASARRVAEGEAMFLDFQEDLAALGASQTFAGKYFALLPAGGVLPANADWKTFLGPLAPPAVTPADAALWPGWLRDTFTREPVAVPGASATPSPVAPLAALKVYTVIGRKELLFARSPLGRLRISLQAGYWEFMYSAVMGAVKMVAAVLRAADGTLRTYLLESVEKWPFIADDLPGGSAVVWFVWATKPPSATTPGTKSPLDTAKDKIKTAQADLDASIGKYQQAQTILANFTATKPAKFSGSGAYEYLSKMADFQSAILSASGDIQAKTNILNAAKDELADLQAKASSANPGVTAVPSAASVFDGLSGSLSSNAWSKLFAGAIISPPTTVDIVNGQTTDLTVPGQPMTAAGYKP